MIHTVVNEATEVDQRMELLKENIQDRLKLRRNQHRMRLKKNKMKNNIPSSERRKEFQETRLSTVSNWLKSIENGRNATEYSNSDGSKGDKK